MTMEDDGNDTKQHQQKEEHEQQLDKQQQMHILHQQTEAQLESIAHNIKETQPLTSDLRPLDELRGLYSDGNNNSNNNNNNNNNRYFLLGIDDLIQNKKYTHYRSTRGDGNCYYRAVLYQMLDRLLLLPSSSNNNYDNVNDNHDDMVWRKNEATRLYRFIKDESLRWVTSVGGYDECAIELFYDCMVECMELVLGMEEGGVHHDGTTTTTTTNEVKTFTQSDLHTLLNEESSTSDYCVWYLRLLAATYCKNDPDRFLPYVVGEGNNNAIVDITTYCRTSIEPVGSEATMVSALALAEALQIQVIITYLDGHEFDQANTTTITTTTTTTAAATGATNGGGGLTQHIFGRNDGTKTLEIHLLYRPGHYDILY